MNACVLGKKEGLAGPGAAVGLGKLPALSRRGKVSGPERPGSNPAVPGRGVSNAWAALLPEQVCV